MSLKPFLDNRFSQYKATFREWFFSSRLDKSVAIVSESRLIISLVYGLFQNKNLVVFASTKGGDFLKFISTNNVGFLCATEMLADMRGDDLIMQSKQFCPKMGSILLVEGPQQLANTVDLRFKSPVVVAVDDMLKADNALRRGFLSAVGGTCYRSPSIKEYKNDEIAFAVQLSDAERQILEFYAAGLTIDEMAMKLPFSKNTVKTYSRNLLMKLGVGNRQKALLKAFELGLIAKILPSA